MSKTLGELVKDARIIKGKTQTESAISLGISRSYLSDIENNRYVPSTLLLLKIRKELGLDLNLLA